MTRRRSFTQPESSEAPARRVWQGIEADEPPVCRHDHIDLLAMAESMLSTRQRRFPDLVRTGRLDQQAAEAELATFAAIVADWRWICTGEGEPAPLATLYARIEALDSSLATIAGIASDQGGFNNELAAQAECVIAMRWHLEWGSGTHSAAATTHALRAHFTACTVCERRRTDPATAACTRTDCGLAADRPLPSSQRSAA